MTLIRNYIMERFWERMSLSEYSGNLILKGRLQKPDSDIENVCKSEYNEEDYDENFDI